MEITPNGTSVCKLHWLSTLPRTAYNNPEQNCGHLVFSFLGGASVWGAHREVGFTECTVLLNRGWGQIPFSRLHFSTDSGIRRPVPDNARQIKEIHEAKIPFFSCLQEILFYGGSNINRKSEPWASCVSENLYFSAAVPQSNVKAMKYERSDKCQG